MAGDIIPHACYLSMAIAPCRPLSRSRQLYHSLSVLLRVFLAYQAMHWPGLLLASS